MSFTACLLTGPSCKVLGRCNINNVQPLGGNSALLLTSALQNIILIFCSTTNNLLQARLDARFCTSTYSLVLAFLGRRSCVLA